MEIDDDCIFPNLGKYSDLVFLCPKEERIINQNMKNFVRYKEKSLIT